MTLGCFYVVLFLYAVRSSLLADVARATGMTGLPETGAGRREGWRATLAAMSLSGVLVAGFLTGVLTIEWLFYFPGIGRWIVFAALQRDLPALVSLALLAGSLFVAGTLLLGALHAAAVSARGGLAASST